ncbi:hypothetical protein BKA56DRAFT_33286 [Ilyonectria sp. MPI-CAGE-AT-0026]|nr:hypothetical protein BKA56DRAFT_33286 [Ilyonectria sp. MPI-CAGE-AT-0026]
MSCTRHAVRRSLPPPVTSLEIPFRMPCRREGELVLHPTSSPPSMPCPALPSTVAPPPSPRFVDARNSARSRSKETTVADTNTGSTGSHGQTQTYTDHRRGPPWTSARATKRTSQVPSQTAGRSKHMAPGRRVRTALGDFDSLDGVRQVPASAAADPPSPSCSAAREAS